MLTRYIDGDLGAYYEYGTNVMVNPPGSKRQRFVRLRSAFVHHMLVDQAFTLEAGRTIWGFPKVMADFTIRDGKQFSFDASIDGQLVIGMEFRPGCRFRRRYVAEAGVARVLVSRRRDPREPV